jgi:hypothetical protein
MHGSALHDGQSPSSMASRVLATPKREHAKRSRDFALDTRVLATLVLSCMYEVVFGFAKSILKRAVPAFWNA